MSTPKVTRKYIAFVSDVLVQSIGSGGYFPYPEPTKKIAHAERAEGCAGWIRQGEISGAFYGCNAPDTHMYGDDHARAIVKLTGYRERAILRHLDNIETYKDGNYTVVKFSGGNQFFKLISDNLHDLHSWRVSC
jgi:hypothetical protein